MPSGLRVYRPGRLFRSAAFRLAVAQALLFALVALLLFLVSWLTARHSVENQLRQTIADEAREMAAVAPDRRAAVVRRELEQAPRSPFDYGLFGPGQALIAGDIAQQPEAGWRIIEQPYKDVHPARHLLALTSVLNDGSVLVVGRNLATVDELDTLLKRTFTWVGLGTVLLALVGGMFTAGGYLRRVETIADAASRIVAGDLGARVPASGRHDEFDRLACALNAMLERIQALVEGLRQVSNDIAHDLRTPLTHMRQGLEAAVYEAACMEDYRKACKRALADTDKVLETFAALLRIAKVESRQRRAGFADVALSALLERLAGDYRPVLEDEGRIFNVQIAPGMHVHGDAVLLTQMFVNLLENAQHHTPRGTPVALALSRTEQACRVIVEDAGPGIPAAERSRVLKRFVRLDASRMSPGNGLGLALVAAVADLHEVVMKLGDAQPGLRVQLDFPAPTSERRPLQST